MSRPAEVLADNPTAFWRKQETSGTDMLDEQENLDGVYLGPTLTTGLHPDSAGAREYDGVDDQAVVDMGDGSMSPEPPFSVEAWVSGDVAEFEPGLIVSQGQYMFGNLTEGWVLLYDINQEQVQFHWVDQGFSVVQISAFAAAFVPHHIAVTHSGAMARLYVDGVEVDSSGSDGMQAAPFEFIQMGRTGNSELLYGGAIDDVAIFPSELSPARVLAHYEGDAEPPPPTQTVAMVPTAILDMSGLSGTVGDIQDDPAAPDADWLTVT